MTPAWRSAARITGITGRGGVNRGETFANARRAGRVAAAGLLRQRAILLGVGQREG